MCASTAWSPLVRLAPPSRNIMSSRAWQFGSRRGRWEKGSREGMRWVWASSPCLSPNPKKISLKSLCSKRPYSPSISEEQGGDHAVTFYLRFHLHPLYLSPLPSPYLPLQHSAENSWPCPRSGETRPYLDAQPFACTFSYVSYVLSVALWVLTSWELL